MARRLEPAPDRSTCSRVHSLSDQSGVAQYRSSVAFAYTVKRLPSSSRQGDRTRQTGRTRELSAARRPRRRINHMHNGIGPNLPRPADEEVDTRDRRRIIMAGYSALSSFRQCQRQPQLVSSKLLLLGQLARLATSGQVSATARSSFFIFLVPIGLDSFECVGRKRRPKSIRGSLS